MRSSNKELIEQYAAVLKEFEETVQKKHQTLVLSHNIEQNKKEKTKPTTEPAPQPGKKFPPA